MDVTAGGQTRPVTELVEAARGGDPLAYQQLIGRYSNLVWATVRSFRLSEADAFDAVQSTWLRLVENLHRLHQPERLAGWLATTASRECLRLRRQIRREVVADEPTFDRPDDQSPNPETAAIDQEVRELVCRAVAELPPHQRLLLRALFASAAPNYANIATATGRPIGSIGPTRGRILRQLRRVLQDRGITPDNWS